MSSIPYNTQKQTEIFDFATNFFKEFQSGKFLFRCNARKMKGVPVMDIFRYLFCLIFSDRSMYMKRKTGNAMNAHTAIVFTHYMMLFVAHRRNTEDTLRIILLFDG